MSLAIDVDRVTEVLVRGTWYEVVDDSFTVDSYEFLWWSDPDRDPTIVHGGGQSGVCASGFSFKTVDGDRISGPLTAVDAVRHNVDKI